MLSQESLKTLPANLRTPLCRYLSLTDRFFKAYEKVVDRLFKVDQSYPENERLEEGAKERLTILRNEARDWRKTVTATPEMRRWLYNSGRRFKRPDVPGKGEEIVRAMTGIFEKGEMRELYEALDIAVKFLSMVQIEEALVIPFKEKDFLELNFLNLTYRRLCDLLDPRLADSVKAMTIFPEDTHPLAISRFVMTPRSFEEISAEISALSGSEYIAMVLIFREFKATFDAEFSNLMLFKMHLDQKKAGPLGDLIMKALPIILQIGEDLKSDIPPGSEMSAIVRAGLADTINCLRRRMIVHYGTTGAWPVALYLKILFAVMQIALPAAADLPSVVLLSYMFNPQTGDEDVKKILEEGEGLRDAFLSDFSDFLAAVPFEVAEPLAVNFAVSSSPLKEFVEVLGPNLSELVKGTPAADIPFNLIERIMDVGRDFVKLFEERYPGRLPNLEKPESVDRALEAFPSAALRLFDKESVEALDVNMADIQRAMLAYWTVATVLLPLIIAHPEVHQTYPKEWLEKSFAVMIRSMETMGFVIRVDANKTEPAPLPSGSMLN